MRITKIENLHFKQIFFSFIHLLKEEKQYFNFNFKFKIYFLGKKKFLKKIEKHKVYRKK